MSMRTASIALPQSFRYDAALAGHARNFPYGLPRRADHERNPRYARSQSFQHLGLVSQNAGTIAEEEPSACKEPITVIGENRLKACKVYNDGSILTRSKQVLEGRIAAIQEAKQ